MFYFIYDKLMFDQEMIELQQLWISFVMNKRFDT